MRRWDDASVDSPLNNKAGYFIFGLRSANGNRVCFPAFPLGKGDRVAVEGVVRRTSQISSAAKLTADGDLMNIYTIYSGQCPNFLYIHTLA